MFRNDIKAMTRGRWPSILMQLGFDQKVLSGRDGPCPMCGGKDRFCFSNYDQCGGWYCRQCGGRNGTGGGGDGFMLIMGVKHVNFRGAVELVEGVLGKSALTRSKPERIGEEQAREAMAWIWGKAGPAAPENPVGLYLGSRGITSLPPSSAVRYAESMTDYDPELKRKVYRPAMISRMVNNERGILHITYLTLHGEKAATTKVKRFFSGCRTPAGGAVRLAPAAARMGVSTGIETSLSVMQKFNIPVWATLSDVGLLKFEPPPECRHLIIFSDRDANYSSLLATISLAHELVKRPGLKVRFNLPPGNHNDWNDVIQAEARARAEGFSDNVVKLERNEYLTIDDEGDDDEFPSTG